MMAVVNFGATCTEVKSVRIPWRFIASNFILKAKALSLGRSVSLCRLESTIKIVAASSSISRTITGMVSLPASSEAWWRRCPAIISYPPSGRGRAIAGVITPNCAILSTVFCMASSSSTLKGCPLKGWSSESGIFCTRSC